MKITIVMFASLFSLSSLYANEISFLKLDTLRSQHQIRLKKKGETSISLNSSRRFFQLYDALETEDIENISSQVDDAFNKTYKTEAKVEQTLLWKGIRFDIRLINSLLAEVSNPVFPEASLFNIRSDILSITKEFNWKKILIVPTVSFFNRWYLDRVISLEEIVTDDIDLDLTGGQTFNPVFLDLVLQTNWDKVFLESKLVGQRIMGNQNYDYGELIVSAGLEVIDNLVVGSAITPYFIGDYGWQDRVEIWSTYAFSEAYWSELRFSRLKKMGRINKEFDRFSFALQYENIRQTYLTENSINNFQIQLGLRY